MKPEEYLIVEARIEKEKNNLANLENELARYGLYPKVTATQVGGFPLEDIAVARIVGSSLHDYYTALENIFRIVAAKIDKSIPQGAEWHRELLEQMALEIPGLRPPVITPTTAALLEPYRGFRHVFRNVYGFNLSFSRVKELLERLPDVSAAVKNDLAAFTRHMRQVYRLDC